VHFSFIENEGFTTVNSVRMDLTAIQRSTQY